MNKKVIGALGLMLVLSGCAHHGACNVSDAEELHRYNKVYFTSEQAELNYDSMKVLNEQIQWLKDNPNKKVIVQGYTDPTGTPAYNMQLGKKRAEAVKNYFVKNGIAANRISVVSFGEQDLASAKNTPQSWPMDRRAITVIATD